MSKLKQIAISIAVLALVFLAISTGLKNKKLRELTIKLLKLRKDMELSELINNKKNEEKKLRGIHADAKKARAKYRSAVKSLSK